MTPARRALPSAQELSLMLVTALWGGTFLVLHAAMQVSGAFFFVGVRFLMAGLFVALLTGRRMKGLTLHEIRAGSLIGVSLATGYVLQSAGLHVISSSRSAFITALYVPLVPVAQWVFLRRRPHIMSWVGIGLAFAGLVLLAGPTGHQLSFGRGEVRTLFAAVAIALEIILISRFAAGVDSQRVTVVQLVAGGLAALCAMPVFHEGIPPFSWVWFSAALALGGLSALVQLVMNWAQKSVSATRATVIYAGEPVWGGLVGWLAGDPLPPATLAGAGCIVAGVLASEMRPRFLARPGRVREKPCD